MLRAARRRGLPEDVYRALDEEHMLQHGVKLEGDEEAGNLLRELLRDGAEEGELCAHAAKRLNHGAL